MSGYHEHCLTCFNLNCSKDPSFIGFKDESCEMKTCPLGCMLRFHSCKETDHINLVCPNSQVSCPNSSYGCPKRYARHQTATHLEQCPASVMSCVHLWYRGRIKNNVECINRVPMDMDKTSDILDVAFANRDQRKIDQLLKDCRSSEAQKLLFNSCKDCQKPAGTTLNFSVFHVLCVL